MGEVAREQHVPERTLTEKKQGRKQWDHRPLVCTEGCWPHQSAETLPRGSCIASFSSGSPSWTPKWDPPPH
ncbi:hypothetical protein CapIbe_015729 [Capra ibex]